MKQVKVNILIFSLLMSGQAMANQVVLLSGEKRLACEALLCLSSTVSGAPAACKNALTKYFSIHHRKSGKRFRKRKNFLNLCPTKVPALNEHLALITNGKKSNLCLQREHMTSGYCQAIDKAISAKVNEELSSCC
jgi:hypothetical protein